MKRVLFGIMGLLWVGCGSGDGGTNDYDAGFIDAAPHPVCGNDVTEYGEACDGADLSGYTCDTLAAQLTSGSLACKPDCSGYDVSVCVAEGQTIDALSCEQGDVQAAVDAAGDGDTVVVPAGQCTWTTPAACDSRVECAGVHIPGTSITLQGAGAESTIIQSDIPEGWAHATVFADTQEGKPVRITGFTFTNIIAPAVSIAGPDRSFRVDHCDITPLADNWVVAIGVVSRAYGVVDHCTLADSEVIVLPDEDDAWNRPLTLGTAHAVYIEDCTFTNSGSINDVVDGRSGARFVYRYNTLTNMELHLHGIEGGGSRGTHSYEFYENTGICDGSVNCYRMAYLRGGTGVLFNNTWTGDWSSGGLMVVHQCVYTDSCTGFKACDRYPCHDQIGRTTDHDGDTIQDLVPLLEWDNTIDGVDVDLTVQDDTYPEMADYIQEGRDYYNDTVTYDPTTGCYDTSFSADNGDVVHLRYKPYVYPHPLVQVVEDLP